LFWLSGLYEIQCTLPFLNEYLKLNIDGLSKLIVLFIGIFSFLYAIYSYGYIRGKQNIVSYYSYYLLTIGAAMGAALAEHLLFFVLLILLSGWFSNS